MSSVLASFELEKRPCTHTSISPLVEIITCEVDDVEDLQAKTSTAQLKPADGDPTVWKILVAAVIMESSLWGTVICGYHLSDGC
jgi:hypothetical protein